MHSGDKISEILAALPYRFSSPTISINDLSAALSGRAYGMLMLVLALPNLIPIPAPGLSAVVGAPLILVTLQMVLGRTSPWLPGFIGGRTVKASQLARICMRAVPIMKTLERITSPRMGWLLTPIAFRVTALMCCALAVMIMLPIPFGNALPAFAICVFAIGMVQGDGLCMLLGLVLTFLATAAISAFVGELVDWIL